MRFWCKHNSERRFMRLTFKCTSSSHSATRCIARWCFRCKLIQRILPGLVVVEWCINWVDDMWVCESVKHTKCLTIRGNWPFWYIYIRIAIGYVRNVYVCVCTSMLQTILGIHGPHGWIAHSRGRCRLETPKCLARVRRQPRDRQPHTHILSYIIIPL